MTNRDPLTDVDPATLAHITRSRFSPLEAAMNRAAELEALCGYRRRPDVDDADKPLCPACRALHDGTEVRDINSPAAPGERVGPVVADHTEGV